MGAPTTTSQTLAQGFNTIALALLFVIAVAGPDSSALENRNWGISLVTNPINNDTQHAPKNKIIVAIIDTGIDTSHELLRSHIWKGFRAQEDNPRCHIKKGQFIYGYDFVERCPNPSDNHGHGTHVAGIVGAKFNADYGVGGLSNHVELMPIRYYSDSISTQMNMRNTVAAMQWALDHGAQIINYSGGGSDFSEEEFEVMKRAEQMGVLVVAAAGNERSNTDLAKKRYYPASYGLTNIISVAAVNRDQKLIASSNWGPKSVSLAAPGESIWSTLPKNKTGTLTGTSQATPHVSAVAAELWSRFPGLRADQIKSILIQSAKPSQDLRGKVASGGIVHLGRAIDLAAATPGKPDSNNSQAKTIVSGQRISKRFVASGSSIEPNAGTVPFFSNEP